MSQIRRRQIGGKAGGSPLPEGSYWIDNNGLKFVVLADNTTVEVSSGGGSWANGLYIPGQVSDANMTTYDSGGTQIPCGNYTYNVVSVAQEGFAPNSIRGSITLGEGITTIKSRGFKNGGSTTADMQIKFPNSVTSIGDGAITRFEGLIKVNFGCPQSVPGYSIPSSTKLRLIVINSKTFSVTQNSLRVNSSLENHEVNIVFPNITAVPTRPYNNNNGFAAPTNAYSVYLPDALVNEAKASFLGGTTYGVGADNIYGLSEYIVDENHPDYNF